MSRTSKTSVGAALEEEPEGTADGPYKQPLEEHDLFAPPGTPFPNWLAGTLIPVVRASTSGKRFHAPDTSSDEVATACWNDDKNDVTLHVRELRHVEGWYEPCRCAPCRRGFARMGLDVYDDLDLVLPEWAGEFETPAVATRTGRQETAHAPANTAHPYPACGVAGDRGTEWESVDLEEEDDLTRCQKTSCQETFAWMDSERGGT